MQAVILAAGRGVRMGKLTEKTPKSLLQTKNKTLLEYKLDNLQGIVGEVVVVVGYLGHKIKDYFGDRYGDIKLRYAYQDKANGTAGAVLAARDLLEKHFLVMMGDDIYDREDIKECLKYDWAICAKEITNEERGGELLLNNKRELTGIYEKKHHMEHGFMNTGLYSLQKEFLDHGLVMTEGTNEFSIPHTLVSVAKNTPVKILVTGRPWTQISDQNDLISFEKTLLQD